MGRHRKTDAQKSAEKREKLLQKESITAREAAYISERIKPGVGRGEAAQRAGLRAVPRRPIVERTVRKLIKKQENLANVDAARILLEIKRMALVNPQDTEDENGAPLHLKEMEEDTARAVCGYTTKAVYEMQGSGEDREKVLVGYDISLKFEKAKALEMMAKHFDLLGGAGKKGGDRLAEVVAAMNEGPVGA